MSQVPCPKCKNKVCLADFEKCKCHHYDNIYCPDCQKEIHKHTQFETVKLTDAERFNFEMEYNFKEATRFTAK